MSAQLSTDQYLTHYWSIENGTMFDQIGSAHMTQGNFTSFIEDRFACANSALALNGGWTQVPPGIYFDAPEFTISAWVYPMNIGYYCRLIDFGNGQTEDNIILRLDSGSANGVPALRMYNGSLSLGTAQSTRVLKNQTWSLLTATFDGTQMLLYINGTLRGRFNSSFSLPSITRRLCNIGKGYVGAGIGTSSSYFDDLRFYNKSLTQSEIIELMNFNYGRKPFNSVFLYY
jgi:hypothetical protein